MAALAGACSEGAAPAVPGIDGAAEPELALGRDVWAGRCASCHDPDGSGGRGPRLNDGRVLERFPDPADQVELIHQGRNGMPAFDDVLDDAEIEAVVRYTREVLAAVG